MYLSLVKYAAYRRASGATCSWSQRQMLRTARSRSGENGRSISHHTLNGRWQSSSAVGVHHGGRCLFSSSSASTPELPTSADAVVIGGGSMGCNTLYHLTKLGITNAVLLEKDSLTAGTTWHTAGLVWRLRPSDTEIQLLGYGRDLIKSLEAETGVAPGWIENGGLFVASSKARLDEYKRLKTIGHDFGIESFVLGPEETKKLYPLMNVDDVYGTLYSPGDGTIDPAGFCDALSRAAKSRGGHVIQNCHVTGITTEESWSGRRKVTGVETSLGFIKTDCVINCTGAWAPYIGRLAGVPVPLAVMKHAYVVTERIEGIQNMPNVRDHDASVYLRLQGDALSVGGYEENPIFIEKLAKDFAFSLYELDWDVFGYNIDGAVNRVPAIGKVGIKSTVCGPESFTPDHKPLMGEDPNLHGFYHGCAMNSAGMMLGGGCGRQLAEWVIHGRPSLDMFGYDIRRFDPSLVRNRKWVRDRSHEAYAKNYSIVLTHDEPLAGRAYNKGVLYETLLREGCVYQDRQGFERPGWFNSNGPMAPALEYDYYGRYGVPKNDNYAYKDILSQEYTFDFPPHHAEIEKQCRACRTAAAVFDMSYFGKFYITGPDAQKCVDYIFTNDVQKDPGSSVYTCMLNSRGGIESDLTVSILDGSRPLLPCEPDFKGRGFYVAAGGGSWYQALSHIHSVIAEKKFNVEVSNSTRDMSLISVQGPASRSILEKVVDVDLSNEAFPFSTHQMATIDERYLVRMLRLSFVGELGWELHVPNESAVQVYHALKKAGADHGLMDAGYRTMDSLSIEKGYRHWHADVRLDTTPHEAGLAFTCKLASDVEFLGRSVVERQKEEGVSKRIACFTIDEKVPLFGLETVWKNGSPVGHLYRCEYAFTVGKSMGYGYIRNNDGTKITRNQIKEGDYELEIMCQKVKAQVHVQSPFDPKNKRVQGIYE